MLRKTDPRDALQFLTRIWQTHHCGNVFLAARTDSKWFERGLEVGRALDESRAFLHRHEAHAVDLYFCPNAFSERQRLARNCLPTYYAHCDIDNGLVEGFDPPPTILVETSPGRHQGLWQFSTAASPRIAEAVSRKFAYDFDGDRNGWSSTKMLRIPFTINHKQIYNRPPVRLLRFRRPLPAWPDVGPYRQEPPRFSKFSEEVDPFRFHPDEVIQRYRKKVRPRYVSLMTHSRVLSTDRSRCIFMIVASLHSAGASPDEIAAVVWRSPYFVDKHGQDKCVLAEEIHRIRGKLS